MITGEIKSKVDSLWEIFRTGGLTNPLDVIEQMTYLMFIHDLDETGNMRAKEAAMLGLPHKSVFAGNVQVGERTIDGSQLKWSVFHDFPAARMYSTMQEWVFPFIKNLHGDKDSAYSKYMGDAIFKIPTPLMLDKIVTAMDGITIDYVYHADEKAFEFLITNRTEDCFYCEFTEFYVNGARAQNLDDRYSTDCVLPGCQRRILFENEVFLADEISVSDIETIDFTFCGAPEGQLEAACRNDPIHLALR